ncbi:MAG TPA: tryptophan 7-halogenase, partial [Sphingomicrobium sp.]|nr:tryptophan 7-halogenase [Sphingomicrobium sp.]
MTRPVRRVVVVGRDSAAWLAALGLRRALGRAGVHVTLVELDPLLRPVDAFSAVPSLGGLLRQLGLEQSEVLARCSGVPVLGQRFANWSRGAPPFIHAYDVHRPALENVEFFQYWIKARSAGLRVAWEDFSVAASAAKQGRVAPKAVDPDSLSALGHGYHLDARAFVALLAERALRLGVEHQRGRTVRVERDGDWISSVLVDDGRRIDGDLFVDASGAEALLLGTQPGAGFEDWSRWLPCDRLLATSGPALGALPSF